MSADRPYLSLSVSELQRIVDEESDVVRLEAVLSELSHRSTRAAKNLEDRLRARLASFSGGAPSGSARPAHQADLFDSNGGSERSRNPRAPNPGLRDHPSKPMKCTSGQAKPKFPPTAEQIAAVDAFMHGGSLKISAFAGAGKTSTLKLMANERHGRGL